MAKLIVCNTGQASPIEVSWRRPAHGPTSAEVARAIVETSIGHLQRASTRSCPTLTIPHRSDDDGWKTKQSATPLSYEEVSTQLAGLQWAHGLADVALTTTDGRVIRLGEEITHGRVRALRSGAVTDTPKPRRPMKIYSRPGEGGTHRLPRSQFDLNAELDQYGEIIREARPGGAVLGVMEIDPAGNAVILERISNDDRGERFIDQHRPCLGIAAQYPDAIRPRVAIFAENMSGTREVRPDRAGPPEDGVLERDDILLLDDYIRAGWVEAVIWRDPTRIARAVHPGTTIVQRMLDNRIDMYIAWWGKRVERMDLNRLYQEMVYSAHDRDQLVAKLGVARFTKGPGAGNGHLGPKRIGIVRDRRTRERSEDEQQMWWINRAFELADMHSEDFSDDKGLSLRKLRDHLEEEGFGVSFEKLRQILTDPMYATGENTATVFGVEIEQKPIPWKNPVPLDRYMRVNEMLALRQGRATLTPIGEFLFNYVEVLHLQCMDERNKRGLPARIKGHIKRERNGELETLRQYRHAYFVPRQCKGKGRGRNHGFVWERNEFERAVVTEIRKLATHPDVLEALAKAVRHTPSDRSARLTKGQRVQLEREIEELEAAKQGAIDEWAASMARPGAARSGGILAAFETVTAGFDRQIEQRQRRLKHDQAAGRRSAASDPRRDPSYERRVDAFLEIMSLDTPDDPMLRQLRARLFQRIVSRILIDDDGDPSKPITLTIEGALVPEDAELAQKDPVAASADLLDAYSARKNGEASAAEAMLDELKAIETDLSARADKSVSLLDRLDELPTNSQVRRLQSGSLDAAEWQTRQWQRYRTGIPAWIATVAV